MPPKSRAGRPKSTAGLKVVERGKSGALWLSGTVRGRRVRESLGTRDRGLAEEARAAREAELFRGALYGFQESVMFVEAADSYLEVARRDAATTRNVVKLARHFGAAVACHSVDQAAMDGAIAAICPAAAPASALRQVITPAKAILNHAARRGWCEPPRFEKVRAAGKRTDWMSPAEALAMIDAATERFRPMLVFLLGTGARVGEAIDLEWADVDLRHGRAVLRATKNGDDRQVELVPAVTSALLALHGDGMARVGPVFLTDKGKPYRATDDARSGATGGQIKRAFAGALDRAGIRRPFTPHHTRHTWASWFHCLHRDLIRLRQEGGWRTTVMCERYAHLVPTGMADEIRVVWGMPVEGAPIRRRA